MWTVVLLLTPVVVIAVFIWNYRRQAAAREAAEAERMKAFVEQMRGNSVVNPVPTAPAASAKVIPVQDARPVVVSGFIARASLLSTEQAALFQMLRSALQEQHVFPRVSLSAFILPAENLTGFAREARQRRLADAVVDFLVCDKTMRPVAAIHVEGANDAAAIAFAQSCVQHTGLRFIAMDMKALPKADEIRARILGT